MVVALKLHSLSIFEIAEEKVARAVVHILGRYVGHSKFHPKNEIWPASREELDDDLCSYLSSNKVSAESYVDVLSAMSTTLPLE